MGDWDKAAEKYLLPARPARLYADMLIHDALDAIYPPSSRSDLLLALIMRLQVSPAYAALVPEDAAMLASDYALFWSAGRLVSIPEPRSGAERCYYMLRLAEKHLLAGDFSEAYRVANVAVVECGSKYRNLEVIASLVVAEALRLGGDKTRAVATINNLLNRNIPKLYASYAKLIHALISGEAEPVERIHRDAVNSCATHLALYSAAILDHMTGRGLLPGLLEAAAAHGMGAALAEHLTEYATGLSKEIILVFP